MKDLVKDIKCIMADENVSQGDLAVALGTKRQNISQMLNRNPQTIRLDNVQKMADALGYDLELVRKEQGNESEKRTDD